MKFQSYFFVLFLIIIGNNSDASIVYTNISDYYLDYGDTYGVNIDGSGGNEVSFYGDGLTDLIPRVSTYFNTGVARLGTQDVLCINSGQSIGSGNTWLDNGIGFINNFSTSSQFPSNSDRYVGVKFQSGGGTRYGWILVEYTATTLIIKSYAYESSGGSISAGAVGSGTSGIEEVDTEPIVAIFPSPVIDELTISVEVNESFTASIFSYDGSEIYVSASIGNTLKISAANFPNGVYFIQIILSDGRTLFRSIVK